MRLVAIYTVWADCNDLLEQSVNNILPVVDGVIIVYSNTSNHGNLGLVKLPVGIPCFHWEPHLSNSPHQNEQDKRNYGLQLAKERHYTHFIMIDFDEFYLQSDVIRDKERVEHDNLNGLVCPLKVYIKSPTLCCDDHTLVPFITKLESYTQLGNFKDFPFAYDSEGRAHIDPTRRVNYTKRVEMSDTVMHHYSYLRKDIDLKINNSSANLRRSAQTIHEELRDAKPGYVSRLYHKELQEVDNIFNIQI